MPNFKFIKQFSTQVSSGGFNNQISTKTIPQGTVLSGKYVENKTNGTKEVNVPLSYLAIQGATTNVNVPLSYVVETTEPVSKTFYGAFISDEAKSLLSDNFTPPTKKYIFLEDYNFDSITIPLQPMAYGGTPQKIPPSKLYKKGEIVDGTYNAVKIGELITVHTDKGDFTILNSRPEAKMQPILKELNPEQKIDSSVIFKEKPTTTEKPTFFNKKNITIGVFVLVGIGATLALLKWKKII